MIADFGDLSFHGGEVGDAVDELVGFFEELFIGYFDGQFELDEAEGGFFFHGNSFRRSTNVVRLIWISGFVVDGMWLR